MSRSTIIFLLFICLIPSSIYSQEECTVAIVSGKATIDGRPLLWKNRDTSNLDNEVSYFDDGKYPYIGVINAGDTTQVWMGVNSAGFAIMNSESRDLEGDTLDAEGYFMKQALMECATVDEFEHLLIETNTTGRETKANFGVIDAKGAAIFFEAGNHTFTKFDANDPEAVPLGFIVRANFAMTAVDTSKSYGKVRYKRANKLFEKFVKEKSLNHKTILQYIARDLVNEQTNPYPLPYEGQQDGKPAGFIRTYHSINRFRTASCGVFHGVVPGENPLLTSMWIILGEPICGIAVPLWVAAGSVPSAFDGEPTSKLNDLIQQLEMQAYPDTILKRYLDTTALVNKNSDGLLPRLLKIEDEILLITQQKIKNWNEKFSPKNEIVKFENDLIDITISGLIKTLNQHQQY
jgi:hypothetical protein